MGMNVTVYQFDLEVLLNDLVKKGVPSKDIALSGLREFGTVFGNSYLILQNDFWEKYNSYFEVAEFFDRAYGCAESFACFLDKREEMFGCGANCEEVADELGIELQDSED